jgi:hypothetical protein
MAAAVETCLLELDLAPMLLSIVPLITKPWCLICTADDQQELGSRGSENGASFIDISDAWAKSLTLLSRTYSGFGVRQRAEADKACDNLENGGLFATESALGKLRVLALRIQRSPQRRQIEGGLQDP